MWSLWKNICPWLVFTTAHEDTQELRKPQKWEKIKVKYQILFNSIQDSIIVKKNVIHVLIEKIDLLSGCFEQCFFVYLKKIERKKNNICLFRPAEGLRILVESTSDQIPWSNTFILPWTQSNTFLLPWSQINMFLLPWTRSPKPWIIRPKLWTLFSQFLTMNLWTTKFPHLNP